METLVPGAVAPGHRRRARAGLQSAVVGGVVLLIGFAWAFASPAAGAPSDGSVSLFDDDNGRALFTAADKLAPGRPLSQCVRVGAEQARAGDRIWFSATDVGGLLADHVTVTLDSGAGGRFGDCAGFSGDTLWSGTLLDLAAASAGAGLDTGWDPSTDPLRTFRVTVVMDADLTVQGLTAHGDLIWRLARDEVIVDPGPTGSTGPTDGGSGTPTSSPTGTPSRSGSPTTTPTTVPTTPGGPTSGGPVERPDVTVPAPGGVIQQVQEVARRATAAAVAVVKEPAYPLLALAMAGLFLLVQDLIDRRDPKLVAATTRREADEAFPDRLVPGASVGAEAQR